MKSRIPKVTAAERERIAAHAAAHAPALADLRETYTRRQLVTRELAEVAAARTAAWAYAWALTPPLLQQHVHRLEDQVQELLRDRYELELLRERVAAEAAAQAAGGKLGGRPSLLPDDWRDVAERMATTNARLGPRRKRSRTQLDQDIADALNRSMGNSTAATLITATLVRDARRRERKNTAAARKDAPRSK